ncbi:30S ribosomal protein S18 [Candidatus Giovannonibacteria bacterium RIFCSPLOWO2_01_FULL_44_40]|uniref:Small ribosomal subunit protein bS18 n=1 Tax=Candidatus Giovannonibacteria bacterium RIFCSPHIGHO2_01_FULL_45_23 TaxID=1798325 RepID=A0A1F5VJF3_9BACT|nr:MAG: 30S ribosomal protein S18 [Candidatus Giovannonibacteria bacterium RIFCSPHIGHO2_01_FULL_45_23]OGF76434.1 MAG: 30S ribosomal protein S18 [Candidatus Giovannonibacteria bacterium RIFCSPHIGHO2_02_FULL_45_13]OGF80392.1 MAG: 30S ribosomal protein S18 [Candidatus Giovannonibacteria bacterium RIFCSPLOWO2_01_FULL_44_40]
MIKSKQCYFCAANIKVVDFKDSQMLRKFMTPQAQIVPRKKTGACSLHQRKLATAIKRARFLGLAPYVSR